jgi:hypothetical protein
MGFFPITSIPPPSESFHRCSTLIHLSLMLYNLTNLKHSYETHLKITSYTLKYSQVWGSCCTDCVCCSFQVRDGVKFWDWIQIPETVTFAELFPIYLSNFLENSMQKGFEVFCVIIICKMHFPLGDIAIISLHMFTQHTWEIRRKCDQVEWCHNNTLRSVFGGHTVWILPMTNILIEGFSGFT